MFLLVALILIIALPAGLVKRPGPAAPAFLYTPYQLSSSNASLDMAVAVDKAAVVHYVLLPRGVGTGWNKMSAADVQLASQGMGWSAWEVGGNHSRILLFEQQGIHSSSASCAAGCLQAEFFVVTEPFQAAVACYVRSKQPGIAGIGIGIQGAIKKRGM